MNCSTGDFYEIRNSILSDEVYTRGALSSVKRKPRKLLNLRPLNLKGIKKEIEEGIEEYEKQIIPIKTSVSDNEDNQEVTTADQDDVKLLELPNDSPNDNLLKDITNKSESELAASYKDGDKCFREKVKEANCVNSNANYLSQIKENQHIFQEPKNDSFDLDFTALSITTPIKQTTDKINPPSSAMKSEYVKEQFQQFVTPKINNVGNNTLLRNQFSLSKNTILKTPTNSFNTTSAKKLIPYKPMSVHQISGLENQSKGDADKGSNTFPNYKKDNITTPCKYPTNSMQNEFTTKRQNSRCDVSLVTLRNDTFKRIKVNDTEYIIFSLIGRGGSSEVYQCYNLDSKSHVAIKCVSLHNTASASSYVNEVKLLQQLQSCDKIIKMYDYQILESEKKLLVVLENGGKDLSTILKQLAGQKSHIPMYMLLFYWMEMLYAVKQMHSHGIIHSDLKPSNFLKVDEGLKLIDFGIASTVQTDMTSVFKTKQEGSCNYISPEALNSDSSTNFGSQNQNSEKYKIHYKSDVWSLGCILYQFVYRRTPFQHIPQMWPKLAAIMNPDHKIGYPDVEWVSPKIIGTIKKCLQYNVKSRPSVDQLIAEYDTILHNI